MSEVINWMKTVEFKNDGDLMQIGECVVRIRVENTWNSPLEIRDVGDTRYFTSLDFLVDPEWVLESDRAAEITLVRGCDTCEELKECSNYCQTEVLRQRNLTTKWLPTWAPTLQIATSRGESSNYTRYEDISGPSFPPRFELIKFLPLRFKRLLSDNEAPFSISVSMLGAVCERNDDGICEGFGTGLPNENLVADRPFATAIPPPRFNDQVKENVQVTKVLLYPQLINGYLKRRFLEWFGDRPEEELTEFDKKLLDIQ